MRYSKPVWEMTEQVAREMGGKDVWLPLIEIVRGVQHRFPENVNEHTIRCQVIMHCINRHPAHDGFPDKGRNWRERRVFVTDGAAKYRLYAEKRDGDTYRRALRQHGR